MKLILLKFLVTTDTETPLKAYLISDWIRNDNNFKDSEKFYTLLYTKDSNKYFQLKQHYIYVKNSKGFAKTNPGTDGEDYTSVQSILVPEVQDFPFKIIFEIIVNKNVDKNFRLKFKKLSVGDPCFAY